MDGSWATNGSSARMGTRALRRSCGVALGALLATSGCGGNGPAQRLDDASEDASADATGAGSGAVFVVGDSGALQAHLQVEGADLTCGGCAVLVAQAAGGEPPYAYAWSDPALHGAGPVTVCPQESTHYEVTVTDSSGNGAGESVAPR